MLESTFIGLWVFGRDRLAPKVHLATIYLVWAGTWLSAYFIIVANSWMQHPVGYEINKSTGTAQANDIATILFQKFAIFAYVHVILAGCLTGGFVVLGVAAWHLRQGRNVEVFRSAAKLAIVLMVPLTAFQLYWGNAFGIQTTNAQPMKIAATEALWDTEEPASFSIFQIGGFTKSDQTPSFSIEIPGLLSYLATGSFHGKVVGLNQNQAQEAAQFGPGNYMPMIELAYWCMRVMAYLGGLMLLLALWGGWLLWRRDITNGEVVPAGRDRRDRAAVPRLLRRLDPDRDRPPALDRLGPAEDGRRRLAHLDHEPRWRSASRCSSRSTRCSRSSTSG